MSNRYRISFEIDCDYNDPNHWSWRFIHDELDDDDDQIVNGPTVEFLGPTSDFVPTSDFAGDIIEMREAERG